MQDKAPANSNIVVALVGMCGAGKSTVADRLVAAGYRFMRFGQLTLDLVIERGLQPGEASERPIREALREEHGPAAFATLNIPKVNKLLEGGNVVADGMYSWPEYLSWREYYGDRLVVVAVWAPPKMRYTRLASRVYDPVKDKVMRDRAYTEEDARSRDYAEIDIMHKGDPIAMSDYLLVNTGTEEALLRQVDDILGELDRRLVSEKMA